MKLKLFILSLTIVVLAGVIYFEFNHLPDAPYSKQKSPLINTKLPDFKFNLYNQKNTNNIYNLKADKTIIHFWASWCHVCTSEFSSIINYAKKNPTVNILAIAIDSEQGPLDKYLKTLKNINTAKNLMLIWDEDRSISLDLFNSSIVPETYIINKNNEITDKIVGKIDWDNDI